MKKADMQLQCEDINNVCAESEIWSALLKLDGADILELGCGAAELTRQIVASGSDCRVTAMEVDEIQHVKNLKVRDLPNVRFVSGGAEAIPADDASFDIVLMFKSLHHVSQDNMDTAMNEIRRVLKPAGRAYISEPVFAGDFNDILRQFHNEKQVRKAAFAALVQAVEDGRFTLVDEVFFLSPMHFTDFAEFEEKVIGVSHSQHQLSAAVYESVRHDFNMAMTDDGAHFLMPMRVDVLQVVK
jgi:ubiquinone/menaquinone biosynthesis C-methylase UbiE